MMTGNLFWLLFIFVVKVNGKTFFHEPSCIEIEPKERATDFGSTLVYHPKTHSLVAGAPFSDIDGKVYLCAINEDVLKTRKIMCKQIPIDITKKVPNYSRSKSSRQHFGVGASISSTPEQIYICAPLLTLEIPTWNGTEYGACGTCFVSDGTSTNRSIGMVEQYMEDMNAANASKIKIEDFYGGVGWSTLPDVENNLILIAKPMPNSTFSYIDMDQQRNVHVIDIRKETAMYKYMGVSLVLGTFFESYPKLYAFSADTDIRSGLVAFLSYNDREKKMELLKDGNSRAVTLKVDKVGSMFGAALHSANLDADNYTDLLVGAPAQVNIEGTYETGAVHIYMGGTLLDDFPRLKTLCLYSNKDASRFGSSMATSDLDEDGYPEIFVSAPYENDGKGTVYIFSGYEINRFFVSKKKSDSMSIPISDLLYTQMIQNPEVQTLGFSLQAMPVTSLDENGENLLAMGSLVSGKVALYRSVPIITVNVDAHLKGVDRVRVRDENFTVSVTVSITYPSKVTLMTGKIIVTTRVEGDAAWIEKGSSYEILLSKRESLNVTDVVVSLEKYKRGLYKLNVTVQPDYENLKRKDFDTSLVGISPRSNTTVEISQMRECEGEDCMPILSLTFQWSGSNKTHYILGSTKMETMSLVVRNDGGATFGSCARIKITGAKVALLECKVEEGWYKCDLTNIERFKPRSIPIRFDMSKPANKDRSLLVDVVLYNNCTSAPNSENYTKMITYEFNTVGINFNSTNFSRIITDVEMQNVEASPYIEINELYTITNDGYISWSSLPLEIYLQEDSFIKDYLIEVEAGECIKVDVQLKYNCSVDLKPNSTIKVQGTVTLVKDKINLENLVKGKLKIVSHLKMNMEPTSKTYENMYLTKFVYQKTIGLKNNVHMVIAIAVLLGVFVMAIIVIILSKRGFFKRKEKEDLVNLKHEIRKQSIRRPNLPPCLIAPKPEQHEDQQLQEDQGESEGTTSSEKPDVDNNPHQKVPETQGEGCEKTSRESIYGAL